MAQKLTGASVGELAFERPTRSCRHFPENGDAFIFKPWERNALVGLIDGLGHGHFVQCASQMARQHIEQHFDLPLTNLFLRSNLARRLLLKKGNVDDDATVIVARSAV